MALYSEKIISRSDIQSLQIMLVSIFRMWLYKSRAPAFQVVWGKQ